ncbi:hypothetical protein HHL11_09960 [Ramlibacter sp. G-1-2-2]|uniref:Uncharacterized protein n=1 Tax=Ramlibacter agri TaxID=2728837 RepID=A0A848H669_9BURK|nr:hypothetical protein [Ramlibacter agri]NML44073.1 hypothetical protein [Ramlibacter agri]
MNTSDPAGWVRRPRAVSRGAVVVEACPEELVQHIRLCNQATGQKAAPRAASASAEFLRDLQAAFETLPAAVQRLVPADFFGVYLARGLGCSAVVDVVRYQGRTLGSALVIDVDALAMRDANAWASWKESEPFTDDGTLEIRLTIAHAGEDDRRTALQFILLHEIGHLAVCGRRFLPEWWMAPANLGTSQDYAFLDFSWEVDAGKSIAPRSTSVAEMRRTVSFYCDAGLSAETAVGLYGGLLDSDFPTLYAIANAYEDFSECLALYVHTRLLRRPYRLELQLGDETYLVDDPDSVAARCMAKFSFVESLLAS